MVENLGHPRFLTLLDAQPFTQQEMGGSGMDGFVEIGEVLLNSVL